MIKVLPEFWDQFGDIGYLESSGGIVYAPNKIKGTYHFPEHMSEAEIEQLMERSVKENKDLIIDLVKNNRVVYKPGCLY